MDGHMAQKNKNTKKCSHPVGRTLRILEVGTLWANRAELYINFSKESVRRDLHMTDAPMILWNYCMERQDWIHNAISRPIFQNQGMILHEATFGKQGNISNICNFGWYKWVYYITPNSFPATKECLVQVLGPIKNKESDISQAVITSKAKIVPRQSIHPLHTSGLNSEMDLIILLKPIFLMLWKGQINHHHPLSSLILLAT